MEIEIKLPEQKITPEEIESRIRRTLKEDNDKGEGLLSKCLVFIKLYSPIAITDLTDKLQEYYKKEFERAYVYRACDRLQKLGLIYKATIGDILIVSEEEKTTIHRHIESLHRKFLTNISPQFKNRYNIRNYVWFNNGEGLKYLEWACKINNFPYKIKDGKRKES